MYYVSKNVFLETLEADILQLLDPIIIDHQSYYIRHLLLQVRILSIGAAIFRLTITFTVC